MMTRVMASPKFLQSFCFTRTKNVIFNYLVTKIIDRKTTCVQIYGLNDFRVSERQTHR